MLGARQSARKQKTWTTLYTNRTWQIPIEHLHHGEIHILLKYTQNTLQGGLYGKNFKKTEVMQNIQFYHSGIKLEINRRNYWKFTSYEN
jgi:hypothetical protein